VTKRTEAEIPDWVYWKAQDRYGYWHGFELRPRAGNKYWNTSGQRTFTGQGDPNPNWRDTLQEVE